MQIRADAFDSLNHPNWGGPNLTTTSANTALINPVHFFVSTKAAATTPDPSLTERYDIGSTDFLDGFTLTGGETIALEVTNGAAFLYGATTDNVTNDPSVQLARRIE